MVDVPTGSSTDPETGGAPYLRAAAGWMAALLVGVAVAAFAANKNRQNRTELEQAVERTALGDREFFPQTDGPTLTFEGERLVASKEVEEMLESQMRAVGMAQGTHFKLYVPRERFETSGFSGGPPWWVKTGPGQFLRFTR